ncbi:MAG: hypothetical protein HOV79_14780 [Hamadaea sp.]|nr:hypothetical protein [Hamadaea sp.]
MSRAVAIPLIILVLLLAVAPLAVLAGATAHKTKPLVYSGPPPSSEELAYLNLGRALAVQSALASLHVAADMHGRPMAAIRGTTPLQRAVNAEVARGRRGRALVASPSVVSALDHVQQSLYAKGLLTSLDRRTPLGQALLHQQQRQHYYLSPSLRPSWRTYGPAAAGLGVALHGPAVMTAIDPDLARELIWPRRRMGGNGGSGQSGSGGQTGSSCGSSCAGGSCATAG